MPWKYNLFYKLNNSDIFFRCMMVKNLIEFFLKKNFLFIYLKYNLKRNNNYKENLLCFKNLKIKFKQNKKKVLSSQVTISYYNSWYIIRVIFIYNSKEFKDKLVYTNEILVRLAYLRQNIFSLKNLDFF